MSESNGDSLSATIRELKAKLAQRRDAEIEAAGRRFQKAVDALNAMIGEPVARRAYAKETKPRKAYRPRTGPTIANQVDAALVGMPDTFKGVEVLDSILASDPSRERSALQVGVRARLERLVHFGTLSAVKGKTPIGTVEYIYTKIPAKPTQPTESSENPLDTARPAIA